MTANNNNDRGQIPPQSGQSPAQQPRQTAEQTGANQTGANQAGANQKGANRTSGQVSGNAGQQNRDKNSIKDSGHNSR